MRRLAKDECDYMQSLRSTRVVDYSSRYTTSIALPIFKGDRIEGFIQMIWG
mgnify:CR=1 FL=1